MAARIDDPLHLDLAAFARTNGRLEGAWPLADLPRLLHDALPPAAGEPPPPVRWSAQGSRLQRPGEPDRWRLRLQAAATLRVTCQRCLAPMVVALDIQPQLLFVRDENEAERLDEHNDDEDVLALPGTLDLRALIEDELILALPLVPRHDVCPQPLAAASAQVPEPAAGPFAALAALRGTPPDS